MKKTDPLSLSQGYTRLHIKVITVCTIAFVLALISADLLTYKIISIAHLHASASVLTFPLIYVIGDFLTEVYGRRLALWVMGACIIAEGVFDVGLSQLLYLPSPASFHLQAAFDETLGALPRIFLGTLVALAVSVVLNTVLMGFLKARFQGRYFYIRSLISSGVSEAVFVIIGYWMWFHGLKPMHEIISFMWVSYVSKLIVTLLSGLIVALCLKALRHGCQAEEVRL